MTFEEQITQAFDTLTERLRGEIDQEVQRRTARVVAEAPADRAPIESAAPPADEVAARERLAEGFEAIDRARTLTDILDTLVSFAREESPRAVVWLIRGGGPHRWRAPDSATDTDASTSSGSAPASSTADDTPPRLDDGIPLAISGVIVALLTTTNAEPRTSNVALLTRYAAKSLEALTAFKTARALTRHATKADCGLLPSTSSGRPEAVEGRIAADEASEEGTSARRYARLLVSEIKLYHEAAVVEGRRDRDLVSRLGGEITRARVMYEQRVPPHVRERADYFHDELVTTLADGDASLLEVRT